MSASYTCPNGHNSTDSEYCSECGKKLTGTTSSISAASATTGSIIGAARSGSSEVCPDCATPRAAPSAVFCEVCRYNFVTKSPWAPGSLTPVVVAPVVEPVPVPVPTAVPSTPTPSPGGSLLRWEAVVAVDPTLNIEPDPALPCPVGEPERRFPLDFPENLIGRRSERRAIYPEIDLSGDHGVSSRHAILYREANGELTLLDVGSTNGTQINGKEITAGVRTPIKDGDQIVLGCWTRITIRVASGSGGQTA